MRDIQTIQIEFAETCQKLGFLTYQIEEEMPMEAQKMKNQLLTLTKEMQKVQKAMDDQQSMIDKLKAGAAKVDLNTDPNIAPEAPNGL